MTVLNGVSVFVSEFVGVEKSIQIAFPKTKKKRVRMKWSKRPANWATTFVPGCYLKDGTLFAHPSVMDDLMKKAEQYPESFPGGFFQELKS